VGWEKVACWSTKTAISLKRVKIEEKLLWRAYRKSPTLFLFFWVAAIFLLPVSPLRPLRRPFLPYFARAAQQSVLDGTNGLSSVKPLPCAYCRIVHCADIFAIAQLSCITTEQLYTNVIYTVSSTESSRQRQYAGVVRYEIEICIYENQ